MKGRFKGKDKYNSIPVRCKENGKEFECINAAGEWCGLKHTHDIANSLRDPKKSAGKMPGTKQKLHWEYIK